MGPRLQQGRPRLNAGRPLRRRAGRLRRLAGGALLGVVLAVAGLAGQECPPAPPVPPAAGDSLFRWRAEPGLEGVARSLSETAAVRAPLPGIGDAADLLGGRPTVWLLRDLACLEAHGLGSPRPDWVGGVAGGVPFRPRPAGDTLRDASPSAGDTLRDDGSAAGDERAGDERRSAPEAAPDARVGFIALRADLSATDPARLRTVLRHELAHLALARATGGHAPRWLQEGYAQYAAGDWDLESAWRLRLALLRGGGDVLRGLTLDFPAEAGRARLAYMLSYTAVHQLHSLAGDPGLEAVFARLRAGDDVDAALRRVYGITEEQFLERWRESVRDRYGVLYVLSRATVFWILVALLVAWAGWRRRKRDREKMERLREAERREAAWIRRLLERDAAAGGDADETPR